MMQKVREATAAERERETTQNHQGSHNFVAIRSFSPTPPYLTAVLSPWPAWPGSGPVHARAPHRPAAIKHSNAPVVFIPTIWRLEYRLIHSKSVCMHAMAPVVLQAKRPLVDGTRDTQYISQETKTLLSSRAVYWVA
jgi:hypothetical protein